MPKKLVQAGMDGIYYDNIRDWPVFDPARGPAYKLPDGRTQPFFDIFELREFIKRTAVMLYLNKKTFPDGRPVLMAHMTNTNIIPLMSFCNITSGHGSVVWHQRFSNQVLRRLHFGGSPWNSNRMHPGSAGKDYRQ